MGRKKGSKLAPEAIEKAQNQYLSKFETHDGLAIACSLSVSTVRRFLRGGPVNNDNFRTICRALALDPDESIQLTPAEVTGKDSKRACEQSPYQEARNFSNQGSDIPPLPPHYWKRTKDIDRLVKRVTQPSITKLGIFGMTAIGKTVLALALAREPEIQKAFPDGIFWIPCGQERSPTLQMQCARALGAAPQPFVNDQDGRTFLSKQIGCKRCLIILDDVCQLEQISAFDAVGTNCKILLTTQNQELLTASGSEKYKMRFLNEEAPALLSLWSRQDTQKLKSAREVAKKCEGLPMALALCGALIRDGSSWEDLRDALRAHEIGALEHKLGSLEKKFEASVDALTRENAEGGRLYRMLAVFLKNTPIPEAAILTLWLHNSKLDEHSARQLITRLANMALLTVSGEYGKRTIRLHGLQHSYLYNISSEPESLNDKLLEAYQHKYSDGWPSGPDEEYYFKHLLEHLLKIGRDMEFKDCEGVPDCVAGVSFLLQIVNSSLPTHQALFPARLIKEVPFIWAELYAKELRRETRQSGAVNWFHEICPSFAYWYSREGGLKRVRIE